MPISNAAMDGIQVNGIGWKHKLFLSKNIKFLNDFYEGVICPDLDNVKGQMVKIGQVLHRFMEHRKYQDADVLEAMEFFLYDGIVSFIEEDDENGLENWKENVNHHLNVIYDFADYERILIN